MHVDVDRGMGRDIDTKRLEAASGDRSRRRREEADHHDPGGVDQAVNVCYATSPRGVDEA
jgi:hypothetical protein